MSVVEMDELAKKMNTRANITAETKEAESLQDKLVKELTRFKEQFNAVEDLDASKLHLQFMTIRDAAFIAHGNIQDLLGDAILDAAVDKDDSLVAGLVDFYNLNLDDALTRYEAFEKRENPYDED